MTITFVASVSFFVFLFVIFCVRYAEGVEDELSSVVVVRIFCYFLRYHHIFMTYGRIYIIIKFFFFRYSGTEIGPQLNHIQQTLIKTYHTGLWISVSLQM